MNFHDLLSVAAQNQKQAEKKLGQNKRYSTVVPPPKKEVKRVDTEAIKAVLNKKEREKHNKAVEAAKKRQEVKQKQKLANSQSKGDRKPDSKKHARTKPPQPEKGKEITDRKNGQTGAYKNKDHEKRHKHFMEKVQDIGHKVKEKETRKEIRGPKQTSKSSMKKPPPGGGPLDFNKLMELAAKKQHEPKQSAKPNRDDVTSRSEASRNRPQGQHREPAMHHREAQKNKQETSRTHTGKRKANDRGSVPMNDAPSGKKPRLNGVSMNNAKPVTKNGSGVHPQQKHRTETLSKSNKAGAKEGQYGLGKKSGPSSVVDKQRPQQAPSASVNSRTLKVGQPSTRHRPPPPPPYGRDMTNSGPFKRPPARPPANVKLKRRQLDSESEEDEDDGFIDDTPLDDNVDVSGFIKEIFGYDKSKYGYESDYALRSMDASYSQIAKEEARSARIAMMEDMEELRKEKEEMKRRAMKKAKK
ncbi:protein SPT2 homolog [Ptychodera flava]|uniref:protein SPT2 homolog n=1 Tax=Ptychodera flava TaxID=63121 RepID=UPI00396AAC63